MAHYIFCYAEGCEDTDLKPRRSPASPVGLLMTCLRKSKNRAIKDEMLYVLRHANFNNAFTLLVQNDLGRTLYLFLLV